jgi:hypothetical protein
LAAGLAAGFPSRPEGESLGFHGWEVRPTFLFFKGFLINFIYTFLANKFKYYLQNFFDQKLGL